MGNKRIVEAVNTNKRYGSTATERDTRCWAELIALYEDGTWEVLFEYRWNDYRNEKKFNGGRLRGITRAQALEKLEKDYFAGKIEGVFKI